MVGVVIMLGILLSAKKAFVDVDEEGVAVRHHGVHSWYTGISLLIRMKSMRIMPIHHAEWCLSQGRLVGGVVPILRPR